MRSRVRNSTKASGKSRSYPRTRSPSNWPSNRCSHSRSESGLLHTEEPMVVLLIQSVGWVALGYMWGWVWRDWQAARKDRQHAAEERAAARLLLQEAREHLADARAVVEERTQASSVH